MLNTVGTCEFCGAKVRNGEGRRKSTEQLTELHNETCPGLHRVGRSKKGKENE